jgi:acyl-CoA synthetase (AMP-forming)/AMP-acid ligase II
VVNLWGPTESTVAFTHFPITDLKNLPEIVPIGHPFEHEAIGLFDEAAHPVLPGEIGEIWQSGRQVMRGYWRSPELDEDRFNHVHGLRWYRSGDLAYLDPRFGYCFKGRKDRQIKVKGYRVELLEIESAVRRASGRDEVCVIPRRVDGGREGPTETLVCVIAGEQLALGALKHSLSQTLPHYMVPSAFVFVDTLPLGVNGKVDLEALERLIKAKAPDPGEDHA